MYTLPKKERFDRNVRSKYYVYNSVFLTLPFDAIDNTGSLLPLFSEMCQRGFEELKSPRDVVDQFAEKYLEDASEKQKIDLMFRFIQYIERQIVLFDAIEDAAFPIVNNLEGKGSLREIKDNSDNMDVKQHIDSFLENFKVRTVLTAHPTQFYPGSVLGIITDLTEAIRNDNLFEIKQQLSQLGKTPFIKKEKPTPYDEAVSLIWYLENVFYQTAGEMAQYIRRNIVSKNLSNHQVLSLGFWPGGDRDGNPFVTTEITLQVAKRLRTSILKCYYADIRKLKRKLTFSNVDTLITELEIKIYRSAFYSDGEIYITLDDLQSGLQNIKYIVINQHESLYLEDLDAFMDKISLFGLYFASLDIRQNSKIHDQVTANIYGKLFTADYNQLSEDEKMTWLSSELSNVVKPEDFEDELTRSTLESIHAMRTIQQENGEQGSNRYIISNNESARNVIETLAFFKLSGWENPSVDIVPLFEIIDDLQKAHLIMEQLYTDKNYAAHLASRKNKQTIMLGFSDGTKDGGYLMANWSIYQAKEEITAMSRKYGIKVIFFDGRGGPPARGGGKTHKYYASQGANIENHEIQLTIQGQTISSNFGTTESCRFNLENLVTAGITNHLTNKGQNQFTDEEKKVMNTLAITGHNKYLEFKNHPKFVPYLEQISTLKYYAKANIGSRPAKRGKSTTLDFADLRAIPFVGSWSQLKQNVPGFFGVGTALKHYEDSDQWEVVEKLFNKSLFFRTLLENSMMSLAKSFLPLTNYMKDDPEFGDFWMIIYEEFQQTKRLLLKIAGHQHLMENYPDGQESIAIREQIVLPLLAIQQYALIRIRELNQEVNLSTDLLSIYEKLVTRSLFGNTNASRNSA